MPGKVNYLYFGRLDRSPSLGVLTTAFVVDKTAKRLYCGFSVTPKHMRFYKSFARLVADLRLSFALNGTFDTTACAVALQRVEAYVAKSSTITRIPDATRTELLKTNRSVGHYKYSIEHFEPNDLADVRYQTTLDIGDEPDAIGVRLAVLNHVMYGDHQMAPGVRTFLYKAIHKIFSHTKGENQDPADVSQWLDAQQTISGV